MKKMNKGTLGPDAIVALIRPIMLESPQWFDAVRDLMHGRRERFDALVATGNIPASVAPVIARLAAGGSMKLDGRPRKHSFDVEVRAWNTTMCMRHLGRKDAEATQIAAQEVGLSAGQVAGIVEDFVKLGFTLDFWCGMQGADRLRTIEALRLH